jgi:uncharacterized protein DUF6953
VTSYTAVQVAEWMLEQINLKQCLYQEEAVYEIERLFGKEFTYANENGNLAIHKSVLAAFRKITEKTVVWERGERMWRLRGPYDEQGRRRQD